MVTVTAYSQNWQIVWQDEFTNGISADWVFETGTGSGGWGNNEQQYYRRENATTSNGALVITARREAFGGMQYTSSRMKTQGKKSWKYGKIEARISMPSFQGVWPAFWMLGDNITSVGWPSCGEIDIMEHVNTGGAVYGTVHWQDNNNTYANYGGNTNTTITTYHLYTIEWNPSTIKWFVDGVKYHEVNIANGINGTSEFQNNFFILLNLAIGGNWPGFTIDNNAFPASMLVDYVRVYQDIGTPSGVATLYQHCNQAGYAAGLPVGSYTLSQLQSRGVTNDDVSSIRVQSGYQIRLYQGDNFTGASIVKTADDACLVDDGYNDNVTSVVVSAVSAGFSQTIQAENYSAMAGVQTEATSDSGGGLNVGWIDTNDWMAYNSINIPTTGTYTVEYRVASAGGGRLSLDVNGGTTVLGAVNVPATGGWQNWQTISHPVSINAGTYNFGIFAATGGFNLNWWRISRPASGAGARASEPATIIAGTNGEIEREFAFYPNPVYDVMSVVSSETQRKHFKIFGADGTEMSVGSIDNGKLDVTSLPVGIYTISTVDSRGKRVIKRFVKK